MQRVPSCCANTQKAGATNGRSSSTLGCSTHASMRCAQHSKQQQQQQQHELFASHPPPSRPTTTSTVTLPATPEVDLLCFAFCFSPIDGSQCVFVSLWDGGRLFCKYALHVAVIASTAQPLSPPPPPPPLTAADRCNHGTTAAAATTATRAERRGILGQLDQR